MLLSFHRPFVVRRSLDLSTLYNRGQMHWAEPDHTTTGGPLAFQLRRSHSRAQGAGGEQEMKMPKPLARKRERG